MHVLFVEPAFPANQREFVRALLSAGAEVTAISERSPEELGPELAAGLAGFERVSSVVDEGALLEAVRRVQARRWVDRLEATVEAHILPSAHVREATAIPGTSSRTAFLCRDKPAMKEVLREAGVPCAASIGASRAEDARAFAREFGYPLILKPADAAGAAGTMRADDEESLERAIIASGLADGGRCAVEEFVEGHEGFFDTLTIGGEVVHEYASHYFPNVLEAMRTRWISPQIVVTNRVDDPSYDEVKEMGRRVIEALEIGTSATHMEWFFGPKGLRFSEIGCRPPGVRVWDLYAAANDLDPYLEWAKAILHGRTTSRPSRRFSAGMIALRPDRDGTIEACEGWESMRERLGEALLDAHIPSPGTPTQPVEGGYMANAWVRLRHPDYDELRGLLDAVGESVQLRAR